MNIEIESKITDSEWEVMRVVWAKDKVTSKEIIDVLEQKKDWKPATTKTFIGRLVKKGILLTENEGKKYIYSTEVSESEMIKGTLYKLLDHICDKDIGNTIGSLISNASLSFKDIENLQQMLKLKEKDAVAEVPCSCVPGQCKCKDHNCISGH
ncbi:MAG TPA: CopY/TcrY family copper transport repressor [Paenisporosarcina sp.]|nr:CopY/TcrY family copper transport repressor [Paenisporosarcina sp.]